VGNSARRKQHNHSSGVGSQVKVNALAVLLAILLGGWLWGISGMILFIPLAGGLKISLKKSSGMSAFAYLLGDDVPIDEKNESYWKTFKRNLRKKRATRKSLFFLLPEISIINSYIFGYEDGIFAFLLLLFIICQSLECRLPK